MSENKPDEKKCRCGYTKDHPWVVPKPSYSFWGWILVGVGISHPPVEVRLECDKCGEVFERISDQGTLRKHHYR